MKLLTFLVSMCMAALSVSAFHVLHQNNNKPARETSTSSTSLQATMSRAQWLQTAGAALTTSLVFGTTSTPAWAKDVDPSVKGTKKDPAFETCLSQCMYDCTKPKGAEQKSRSECLPECKTQCATTKAQLMKGVPLN